MTVALRVAFRMSPSSLMVKWWSMHLFSWWTQTLLPNEVSQCDNRWIGSSRSRSMLELQLCSAVRFCWSSGFSVQPARSSGLTALLDSATEVAPAILPPPTVPMNRPQSSNISTGPQSPSKRSVLLEMGAWRSRSCRCRRWRRQRRRRRRRQLWRRRRRHKDPVWYSGVGICWKWEYARGRVHLH